jgi:hypothetical protein
MSQMDGETLELDGHKYTVYMLPPLASHDSLMDVAKMVGPALGPVFDVFLSSATGNKKPLPEMELDTAFFSRAASALFGGIDKATLRRIIDQMAEVTHVDGKPLKPIFDAHFRGKLEAMYQWAGFAMKVQWGKSLSALVNAVRNRGAQVMGAAPSPSQAT